MAFHTIWSVDLGRSSLKAVRLRRDHNNVEILAVDKVDYPISKNGVDASAEAKEALSIFRARNGVKEPVAVVHPGQGTFSRFIKVPAFDEKKVNEMVGYEASQQIPFPLDEVVWDFHVVRREYLPGEERDVALFAVRREAMDDYLVDYHNEALSVEVVSIGYLGILNFIAHDIRPEEPCIVLDIGANHTDLVLVNGDGFWIRPIPHSGSDITRAIMSRFRLGFPEAEKLKIESSRAPKQAVKIFQAVIQPKLKELVGEVHRSIGFYRSQAGETTFKRLYLLGNGSRVIGIVKFLKEQLGLEVARVQSIQHFRVNRGVNLKLLKTQLPSFAATLGCGVQALGLGACEVDLVPKEEKLRKEIGRKKKHVFIAAAIILVSLFLAKLMIGNKVEAVAPILRDAKSLLADVKGFQGQLDAINQEEGGRQLILKRREELKLTAETRPLVVKGFQALETVLATSFPGQKGKVVTEPQNESKISQAARQEYLGAGISEQLWVPWVNVTLTKYPEEAAERKTSKIPWVPAYRFEAYVVVKMRANRKESDDFIRERFAQRLETELKTLEITKVTDVTVAAGSDGLKSISYDPVKGPGFGATEQEGAPFYGAKVSWLLVPRFPPEAEKDAGSTGR